MLTKFISNRPGAFYKSGVLNNIVKLTGKKLWRSWKAGSPQVFQKNCGTDVFL